MTNLYVSPFFHSIALTVKQDNKLQQHENITSTTNATAAATAAALLINPFTLHTDHTPSAQSTTVSSAINTSSATLQQTHQNVRDMDIVHVNDSTNSIQY